MRSLQDQTTWSLLHALLKVRITAHIRRVVPVNVFCRVPFMTVDVKHFHTEGSSHASTVQSYQATGYQGGVFARQDVPVIPAMVNTEENR